MFLAGVSVDDRLVYELAGKLRDAGQEETAEKLERAADQDVNVFALTAADREVTLRVLEEGSEEFADLRAVLLAEHEWRVREGLAER